MVGYLKTAFGEIRASGHDRKHHAHAVANSAAYVQHLLRPDGSVLEALIAHNIEPVVISIIDSDDDSD